jgi:phosphoglucomutase
LEGDARFPTVKSPNPENAEALSRAVALAERLDCRRRARDRSGRRSHGVAVRNRAGKMELLTGNQIGALLADYRLTKYKERAGFRPPASDRASRSSRPS